MAVEFCFTSNTANYQGSTTAAKGCICFGSASSCNARCLCREVNCSREIVFRAEVRHINKDRQPPARKKTQPASLDKAKRRAQARLWGLRK